MSKSKLTKQANQSAAQQISILKVLSQQSAAWLLGVNARTLRDRTEIERNPDGTYSAVELVRYAAGRMDRATLADDALERLLVAVEAVAIEVCTAPHGTIEAVVEAVEDIVREHGDAGLLAFADQLLSALRESVMRYSEPSQAELDLLAERERMQAAERRAVSQLKIAVVCEFCGRLRNGTRWIERDAPAGFVVVTDVCPSPRCRKKAKGTAV